MNTIKQLLLLMAVWWMIGLVGYTLGLGWKHGASGTVVIIKLESEVE